MQVAILLISPKYKFEIIFNVYLMRCFFVKKLIHFKTGAEAMDLLWIVKIIYSTCLRSTVSILMVLLTVGPFS